MRSKKDNGIRISYFYVVEISYIAPRILNGIGKLPISNNLFLYMKQ